MTKKCIKCEIEKDLEQFEVCNRAKDGKQSKCKSCRREIQIKNRPNAAIKANNYYHKNQEKILKQMKERRLKNIESARKTQRAYAERNRDRLNTKRREYCAKRRLENINIRILENLRARTRLAIKNNQKTGSALEILGCSVDFLKIHLKSQFTPEMNWENYGSYWEMDHIKACCLFNLALEEEQRKCFHYSNLQPLLKSINTTKGQIEKQIKNGLDPNIGQERIGVLLTNQF